MRAYRNWKTWQSVAVIEDRTELTCKLEQCNFIVKQTWREELYRRMFLIITGLNQLKSHKLSSESQQLPIKLSYLFLCFMLGIIYTPTIIGIYIEDRTSHQADYHQTSLYFSKVNYYTLNLNLIFFISTESSFFPILVCSRFSIGKINQPTVLLL